MKKRLKVLFCAVVCLSLSVGCQKSTPLEEELKATPEPETKGIIELTESAIPFPKLEQGEEVSSLEVLGNEVPVIITYKAVDEKKGEVNYRCYQWIAGNWEETEMPWMEAAEKERFGIDINPIKGQDENYYLLRFVRSDPSKPITDEDTIDSNYKLYRLEDNNQLVQLETEGMFVIGEGDSKQSIDDYMILEDGSLLVLYFSASENKKIIRYDLNTGQKLNEFESAARIRNSQIYENNIYTMNEDMDKILVTDIMTGDILKEIKFNVIDERSQVKLCLDEEGNLYIVTKHGIYYKNKDAEEPELLLPADKCEVYKSNDDENVDITEISKKDDNIYVSYYVSGNDSDDYYKDLLKIYQYNMAE